MAVLLGIGFWKLFFGELPEADTGRGAARFGREGNGLLMGAALSVVLHAFASGGAAVTGVEAISTASPRSASPSGGTHARRS